MRLTDGRTDRRNSHL